MRRPKEKLIAGIDLHSNNVMIGVINQDGKRVAHRKLDCDLSEVVEFLKPFKPQLQSMAVESTFNWYWLVDGLRAQGYPIDLANPAKIEQYSGMKHADDKDDAFHLADLQRLNILPNAHVYDPELRPVRDLLRRRTNLVHQRTALMLSFKSLYTRTTGQELDLSEAKKMEPKQAPKLYEHPANQLIAQVQAEHIEALAKSISRVEKAVLACAREIPLYEKLLTLPGIGQDSGDDHHDGSGRHQTVPDRWRLRQLLPDGGCQAAEQRQEEGGQQLRNAATSIWPGRLWKRPTSRGATTSSAGTGLTARRPRPAR